MMTGDNEYKGIEYLKREIEREEELERLETTESIGNEMKRDKLKTKIAKQKFIDELKNDFGKEMKHNPNQAKYIKPSFFERLKRRLNNFFKLFDNV